ncbi:Guanine nucleotide exchange factor subunit R06F6.8 [Exaiptasia diaphana]|nr:Guanine nucleotide exchange factor subunit R06F6.8 [Exaiptasia diaphana]
MFFPIGWPKYYTPRDVECGELSALKYNRDRSLLAVISSHSICIWNNRPRVLIVTLRRSPTSIKEVGTNVAVVWKPDSSVLAVSTSEGKVVFLELQRSSSQQLYKTQLSSSSYYHQTSVQNGVPAIKLVEIEIVTIAGDITCFAARRDELFVCSGKGFLHRITWDGYLEENLSMPIHSLPFTNDLENVRAVPLELEGVCFRAMVYSPLLGGFAVVLADGRGGFLSAETSTFEPSEMIGVWARDLNSATCVAINHRYRLIVFGCTK